VLIRESRDQCSFDSFPGLIAVFHALHRLLAPRHPPHALNSLAALILSSIRVRHAPRNGMLPATRPSRLRPGHSNDPVSPKGSCRDRKKLQREVNPEGSTPTLDLVILQLLPLPNCQRTCIEPLAPRGSARWPEPGWILEPQKETRKIKC
jgi:hypothetical protein